jgi:hypothetical protein
MGEEFTTWSLPVLSIRLVVALFRFVSCPHYYCAYFHSPRNTVSWGVARFGLIAAELQARKG